MSIIFFKNDNYFLCLKATQFFVSSLIKLNVLVSSFKNDMRFKSSKIYFYACLTCVHLIQCLEQYDLLIPISSIHLESFDVLLKQANILLQKKVLL